MSRYVFRKKWKNNLMGLIDGIGSFFYRKREISPAGQNPRKILVVRLDQLGDVVQTLPFWPALRKKYPEAEIHALIVKDSGFLLEHNPDIDKLHLLSSSWFYLERPKNRPELKKIGEELRKEKFDLVFDLRGDIRTIYFLRKSGIKNIVGYGQAGGHFWLAQETPYDREEHEIDKNLKHIGQSAKGQTMLLDFHPPAEAEEKAEVFIAENNATESTRIVMHPFTRAKSKLWGFNKYRQLIQKILAQKPEAKIFIIGAPGEREFLDEFNFSDQVIDAVGNLTLPQTVALIKKADIYIGNDSGPQYFAAYQGVRSCIIYGYTINNERWRPKVDQDAFTGLSVPVPCGPCELLECNQPTHRCMDAITVEMVCEKIKNWL